ncbi:CLUMA_CG016629, isoform A [Clunio marinus]|uniref:CLUMA_CG016629, isoform A n=1 Tax=Clunio marinus TaxID=568069 RepID=A0A1J1ISA9_9DIPT|nr:CLUMA_CG016629, isoform A [Clunio marinus]
MPEMRKVTTEKSLKPKAKLHIFHAFYTVEMVRGNEELSDGNFISNLFTPQEPKSKRTEVRETEIAQHSKPYLCRSRMKTSNLLLRCGLLRKLNVNL